MFNSIDVEATGKRIKYLCSESGLTVKDLQNEFGFECSQAIYKWFAGKGLPSLDSFLRLGLILGVPVEDMIVYYGDEPFDGRVA